jgi:hypothetical protein
MTEIFITHRFDEKGTELAGEKIYAESWDDADKKAQSLGVEVLGILRATVYSRRDNQIGEH